MKEENKFRFFEVSFYIMAVALVGMVAIVLYYIAEKPKTCDYTKEIKEEYDINHDGIVDVYDILEETNKIEKIQERILNEN